jgi:spore germination cell wall hydrolase CwlJ-like protein
MTKSLLIEFAMLCVLVVVLVCIPAYASHKQLARIQQLEFQLQQEREAQVQKERELYQLQQQLTQVERQRTVACLAINVYHEARGESVRGMEAVAQVTLNRTADEKFPDDVCAVVHQKKPNGKCQFSWYCDNKSDKVVDQKSWEVAVSVAERALRGYTAGAIASNVIYYHSTRVRPYWSYKKRLVAVIGRHKFYSDRT